MTTKMITAGPDRISMILNDGLEIYLEALTKEKVLTEEQQTELSNYKFVVHQKGFFGKLFTKLKGQKDNDFYYSIVKVLD
jgi:hypothetical protein